MSDFISYNFLVCSTNLLGSAALTTFTTMYAGGAYGRRKRSVDQDLYEWNVEREAELKRIYSLPPTSTKNTVIMENMDWRALDNSNNGHSATSQLVRFSFGDTMAHTTKPASGINWALPMPNTNASLPKVQPNDSTLSVRHKEYISPYQAKADSVLDFVTKNNNGNNREREDWKKKEKSKWNKGGKMESNTRDVFLRSNDFAAQESRHVTTSNSNEGFDFNTWIPFLTDPYMVIGEQQNLIH